MKNNHQEKLLKSLFAHKITPIILDNGLTILTKEDNSSEVISIQVWVKTGSIHEGVFLGSGISHYLEHMLFKGTSKRNYKQVTEDLQKIGANINAYTTFDRTVYHIDGPKESLETSLDVLSDILFNSAIDSEEVGKEQSVILREIDMGLDDPDRQLSQSLFKTTFREHPYRHPVIGERALFQKITAENIRQYYKERYVPNNMTLIIVGSCDQEKMLTLAKRYFEAVVPSSLPSIFVPEEPKQLAERSSYKQGDYEIVRGAIAYRIPNLSHRDTPGLSILANLLGQGESSHLWQKLREEKNLVQEISTSIWSPGSSGLFTISYICSSGKREAVEKAIDSELNNFYKKPIPKAKIKKAVTQAIVAEINSLKTMSGQTRKLGIAEVVIGDLNYPERFIHQLKKVSIDSIKKLLKTYLTPEARTRIALEPIDLNEKKRIEVAPSMAIPDFETITLKNGLRIILQPFSNVPKMHISIGLLGGPLYESPEIRGATGILSTLLTKDTKKQSALKIAEMIENIGGSFNEFAGNNTFGLNMEVLPHDFKMASKILKEALLEPNFKEKQFQTERDAQIAAIQDELDDITAHGGRYLRQLFFGNHPYRDDPLGSLETLEKLDLKQVKTLYNTLLSSHSMVVAVTGQFDRNKILKELTPWLERIPENKSSQITYPFENPPNPGNYEKFLDREQIVVFEAYKGSGIQSIDFDVSELADELLSGMSSNLFIKVREEQAMAYFIGSSRMTGINTGMFYLYGGTNKENYTKVFQEMENELERLKRGQITDDEFNRCKTCLKSNQRLGLQTPSSRANQAMLDTLYKLPTNHWKTYVQRIDAITKDQIKEFAINHFNPSNRVRLTIGKIDSNRQV